MQGSGIVSRCMLAVGLALALVLATHLATPSDGGVRAGADRARAFLDALASKECNDRQNAVAELYRAVSDSEARSVSGHLEAELKSRTGEVARKGRIVLDALHRRAAFNRGRGLERWVQSKLDRPFRAPLEKKPQEFRRLKDELLAIARDPKRGLVERAAALDVIGFVLYKFYDPDTTRPESLGIPMTEWRHTAVDLVTDPDPDLAVMAATGVASLPGFTGGNLIQIVVPRLIAGLRHEDFETRFAAQRALERLSKQSICVDPTDPLPERLLGIRRWERWWETSRDKR